VRKLAEKYGDPDDLLGEDWIPQIPGITAAGSYDEYAGNPGRGSINRRREVRGAFHPHLNPLPSRERM
jgi:hypothetical protein